MHGNTGIPSGASSISGNGEWRITGGTLGNEAPNTPVGSGRGLAISLGTGARIDIQSGATLLNGGWQSLEWSGNQADLTVDGTLDLWDGNAVRVDALNGSGSITKNHPGNSPTELRLGVDGGSGTFSGSIANPSAQISLVKTGSGRQILSGANSHTGGTTITGGTLQVGNGGTSGTLGTGNVSISNGANLEINRSDAYGTGSAQSFSGSGTITKEGTGNLVFNGGVDHTNVQGISNLVVNNGLIRTDNWGQWNTNLNLTVNGPGVFEMWNTSVSLANLNGNGTVQNAKYWGRSQTLTIAAGSFSGTITDNGITSGGAGTGDTRIHLIKSSSGTLTLAGTVSHSGDTTVNDGTLVLAATGSLKFTLTSGGHNRVTGAGTAQFHGSFAIDTSALTSPTIGTSWQLVDMASRTFGPTFHVVGFSPQGDGVRWTQPAGGLNEWVFSETTGTLTLAASDYLTWADAQGLAGGENADDDQDGLSNRQEYAFGTDPKSGASAAPVTITSGGGALTIRYTRRDPSKTGLTYSVWTTTDLSNWIEDSGATQMPGAIGANDVQPVTVTPSAGLLSAPKLFIQIRAR